MQGKALSLAPIGSIREEWATRMHYSTANALRVQLRKVPRMKPLIEVLGAWSLVPALAMLAATASAASFAEHPIVVAINHGSCKAAVKLINLQVASNDAQTAFLAARMLDEGICVLKDPVAATPYFSRAADLGDHNAALDYAAKVGLGEGAEQRYERAGSLCRTGGLDPQGRMSSYSLGYACTVSAVAARLLRESLPQGAFLIGGGPAVVEFDPATAVMRVRSTPQVGMGDAAIGFHMRRPLINAQQEIDKAWHSAMAAVPKPDAARLDEQSVELPIDLDTSLEAGRKAAQAGDTQALHPLTRGELVPELQPRP